MFENLRRMLDFDDLLFETRNRDYGAYQLRKRYNSVVVASIITATVLVSTIVILPFIIAPKSDRFFNGDIRFVQVKMENLETPVDQIIVPPPPPPPEVARIQEDVKYVPPVVVDSVLPVEATHMTTDEFLNRSTDN
jgi:periplasmic protein TonB